MRLEPDKINSSPKSSELLFSMGLVAGIVISYALLGFNWSDYKIMESRERLVRIYDEVALGENETSVAKKIIANVDRGRIFVHSGSIKRIGGEETYTDKVVSQYYVSSPMEFFVGNWGLSLCFVDGQLHGSYFGTSDDADIRPPDAPLPKGEMC